ncbi:uncharacterized protein LOC133189957 [Saccostrea echinata]|uniref:uncharacterized protein LOC133189957 n=1 Tax=Saccostrea echinata TaxID=191078 RepID=UPI002A8376E0|nr:uncharacterized protein LOC133189957 [Saccostrea echinata]
MKQGIVWPMSGSEYWRRRMSLFQPILGCIYLILSSFTGNTFGIVCQRYVSLESSPGSNHDNQTIDCPFACFASWRQEKPDHVIVLQQGCMGSHKDECMVTSCQQNVKSSQSDHKFCCCSTDQCNIVQTEGVIVTYKTYNTAKLSPPVSRKSSSLFQQPYKQINTKWPFYSENDQESAMNVHPDINKGSTLTCAFYDHPNNFKTSKISSTPILTSVQDSTTQEMGKQLQKCEKEDDSCFTIWSYDQENDTESLTIIKQGCFQSKPDNGWCSEGVCKSSTPYKMLGTHKRAKFCCCTGSLCNNNISDVNVSVSSPVDTVTPASSYLSVDSYRLYKEKTIIISLVSICSISLIVMASFLLYRICLSSRKQPPSPLDVVEAQPLPGFQSEDLRIMSLICKTKNGEVWKGQLGEVPVAVKVFSQNHKHLYQNEKYIYSLPFIEQENLLKFYGTDERQNMEGFWQYMIVLSYVPRGSLFGYLQNNTIDWETFSKMCLSIVKGLVHLHTDLRNGDQFKPTIAHRDLNSRNILVQDDLTCVIGDLGFAITTMGSKLIRNGQYEYAEQASLQDVGTLRYMAPELLDGAANLRESEASLKQIDVYSLGLVLWELATRCQDLYHSCPVPDYQMPYQQEAGSQPTFEEMQILVSRNKVRPKMPEVWQSHNQAVYILKETIEECWDHDSEARLTAVCVEERILDMIALWSQEGKQKGMTPTITTTSNSFQFSSEPERTAPETIGVAPLREETTTASFADNNTTSMVISSPPNGYINSRPSSWYNRPGMTTSGSTTETFVMMSPSEEDIPPPVKLLNVNLAKNNMVLPVHQGRNPTVERNTHKRSDEELSVSGNKLVYNNERSDTDSGQRVPPLLDDLLHSFSDSLETSLVQNDVLGQHRNPPIPFLQNQVHESRVVRPKVANVPQAMHLSEQEKPHQSRFKNLVKVKDIGSKLPFFKKKGRHFHKKIGKHGQENASEVSNLLQDQQVQNPNLYQDQLGQRPSTWCSPTHESSTNAIETEIRMTNGRPFVQPSDQKQSNVIYMAEMGRAKMETPGPRSAVLVTRSGGHSKSASDISPQREFCHFSSVTELDDVFSKRRRPNSLSLRGHNYKVKSPPKSNTCESFALLVKDSEDDGKIKRENSSEKIKKRVKTPVTLAQNRLSLYDDRLMTHYIMNTPEFTHKPMKGYSILDDDVNANIVITTEQSC